MTDKELDDLKKASDEAAEEAKKTLDEVLDGKPEKNGNDEKG